MSKTKKELEMEVISLTSFMRDYVQQNANLRLKIDEMEKLLLHYERTIAVVISRKIEDSMALSSQAAVGDTPAPQI